MLMCLVLAKIKQNKTNEQKNKNKKEANAEKKRSNLTGADIRFFIVQHCVCLSAFPCLIISQLLKAIT